jgi:hypothetical protein
VFLLSSPLDLFSLIERGIFDSTVFSYSYLLSLSPPIFTEDSSCARSPLHSFFPPFCNLPTLIRRKEIRQDRDRLETKREGEEEKEKKE